MHPAHPGKATNTLGVERGHVLSNLYLEQFSSELVCVCVCVTVLWGWQSESRFIGASFHPLGETGVDLMFSLLTLSGGKKVVKVGAWVRCLFRWCPLEGSCFMFGILRGSVMLSCPTGDVSWTLLSSRCLRGCRHCWTSVPSSAGEQSLVHTGG